MIYIMQEQVGWIAPKYFKLEVILKVRKVHFFNLSHISIYFQEADVHDLHGTPEMYSSNSLLSVL